MNSGFDWSDPKGNTVITIKAEAKRLGVTFPQRAKKDEMLQLLQEKYNQVQGSTFVSSALTGSPTKSKSAATTPRTITEPPAQSKSSPVKVTQSKKILEEVPEKEEMPVPEIPAESPKSSAKSPAKSPAKTSTKSPGQTARSPAKTPKEESTKITPKKTPQSIKQSPVINRSSRSSSAASSRETTPFAVNTEKPKWVKIFEMIFIVLLVLSFGIGVLLRDHISIGVFIAFLVSYLIIFIYRKKHN